MADQDDASKTLFVHINTAESKEDGSEEAERPVENKRPRKNLTYSVSLVDLRTLGDSPVRKCYEDLLEGTRREIAKNPEDDAAGSYALCGIALCELGRLDEAIEAASQAIWIDSRCERAYFMRALVYGALGKHKKAILDYTSTIQLDPKFPHAHRNRASSKYSLGLYKEAIDDFTEAIKLDPMDCDAYYNRGVARSDLGLDKEADQDFEQSKRLEQK